MERAEEESKRPLRLIDDNVHEMFGGVCAGLAYYLGMHVWIVRMMVLALVVFSGTGLVLYLVFWWLLPKWESTPDDYARVTGD